MDIKYPVGTKVTVTGGNFKEDGVVVAVERPHNTVLLDGREVSFDIYSILDLARGEVT